MRKVAAVVLAAGLALGASAVVADSAHATVACTPVKGVC
jgi:hypothetical protein